MLQDCLCVCFEVTPQDVYLDAAFFGELGYELLTFTPMIHYYHTMGKLRRTVGPIGESQLHYTKATACTSNSFQQASPELNTF